MAASGPVYAPDEMAEALKIKEFDSLMDLLEELDREGISGDRKQEIYKRYLNFRARMRGQVYSGGFELTPLCNFDCTSYKGADGVRVEASDDPAVDRHYGAGCGCRNHARRPDRW